MMLSRLAKLISTAVLLILATIFSSTALATHPTSVNIEFKNHLQLKLPEQDVFVVSSTNPSEVVRIEGVEASAPATLSKMVYASSRAIDHDPFKVGSNPLGPFPKGQSLGFTLEKWLDGTGTGTYSVTGNQAQLNLTLEKLIANATYTVWCSRLTLPPNVKVVDTPCGKDDGSENVFKTNATGNGSFNLNLRPLSDSSQEEMTVIALAYHSDGKSYGPSPGDFGLNSHVQLAYLVPPAQAAEAGASPAGTAPAGQTQLQWLVAAIVVILIIWILWKRMGSSPPPPPASS